MSFAAPAIIILLMFLPGVILRNSYLRGTFESHPFKLSTIAEELAYGAIGSLALHTGLVWISRQFCLEVKFELLTALVFGPATNNLKFGEAVVSLSNHVAYVAGYFFAIYFSAYAMGRLVHQFVRWGKLDVQTKLWRFEHPWHYILDYKVLDFDRTKGPFPSDYIDFTMAAALVHIGDTPYVYRGIVDRYEFDGSGVLDRIILSSPKRATLQDIEKFEGTETDWDDIFVSMEDTSVLIIFMKDVLNLSIDYIDIMEEA